jgi:hypothetical protein
MTTSSAAGVGLLVVGYPVAVGVLARLVPVLRQRRRRAMVALEVATVGIAAGWGLRGQPAGVASNAAAFVGFAVAWWWTGRRQSRGGAATTACG